MNIIQYPPSEQWESILTRPQIDNSDLVKLCRNIFADIMSEGDTALYRYTQDFDKTTLDNLKVSKQEIKEANELVSTELKFAIREAYKNIYSFHQKQIPTKVEFVSEEGFRCWQEARAIEKVGLYIPGGSAPLFSTVLMLAIPANLAGCKEIILCTPPNQEGKINPAILWTAQRCGVTAIYKIGGIQAIGAMTLGTETIPKVYKIFGPGNQYVMAAKQLANSMGVAIDMPAGPSEVMVLADDTANADFVASDMLSQAEHGPDSQAVLVTTSEKLAKDVEKEITKQLSILPREGIATKALQNSKSIVLKTLDDCISLANEYAAEHLIICTENYLSIVPQIINAGSVFLGNYSPESAGDYASGTNHTLPTNGFAKAFSGVNMDSFIKKITFQELSSAGLHSLAPTIETMAEAEQLMAHKLAVSIRIKKI